MPQSRMEELRKTHLKEAKVEDEDWQFFKCRQVQSMNGSNWRGKQRMIKDIMWKFELGNGERKWAASEVDSEGKQRGGNAKK